jgi:hypothetical protein
MAAAQPARFGASGDDIADWMAQRWRDIANLGPEAEDGRPALVGPGNPDRPRSFSA